MSSDIERAEDMRMDVGALVAAVLSRGLRIVLVTALLLVAIRHRHQPHSKVSDRLLKPSSCDWRISGSV